MATVLLADDVGVVRLTLRRMLERGGHSVVECGSGTEAAERLKGVHIDVIVTDLWIPDGDGLEFIRKVKAASAVIPVIAITGGAPRAPTQFSIREAIAGRTGKCL